MAGKAFILHAIFSVIGWENLHFFNAGHFCVHFPAYVAGNAFTCAYIFLCTWLVKPSFCMQFSAKWLGKPPFFDRWSFLRAFSCLCGWQRLHLCIHFSVYLTGKTVILHAIFRVNGWENHHFLTIFWPLVIFAYILRLMWLAMHSLVHTFSCVLDW